MYNSLNDEGYNLFNSEDSFYQDICSTYTSLNGTDMILSDRKKDIYGATSDMTMCQTGCTLESYNSTTKKAKCNCDISSTSHPIINVDIDSLFDKNEIKSSFYETLSNSNFHVLKCYKKVFSSKFIKNIGGIFMTLISIAFLIFNSLSLVLHQKVINNYIMKIINLRDNNIASNEPQIEYKNNFDTSKVNKKQKTKKMVRIKKGRKKNLMPNPHFLPKIAKINALMKKIIKELNLLLII